MAIQDMHYDFKSKFNKIDSQQNRNLRVPEIDWVLNEAEDILVKTIAYPRIFKGLGVEINQRSIEDIRPIIKVDRFLTITDNEASLPKDYDYPLRAYCIISKGKCKNKKASFKPVQYDDEIEDTQFNSSSFKWREVMGRYYQDKIKLLEKDFTVDEFYLDYIIKRPKLAYPSGTTSGSYNTPSGDTVTADQSSLLTELEKEIVDIAVMLKSGQINSSLYNVSKEKLGVLQLL